MRKLILTLLISLILLQAVTPTLIITHSTPKIFRLTKTKMAIVIDEPEDVAQDHLERVKANEISREQSGPTYQQTPQATPQRVAVDQAESESDTQQGRAVFGQAKVIHHKTQLFHHQVQKTHDDGQTKKTHKQVTRYGQTNTGAAHIKYGEIGGDGLPSGLPSNDHSSVPSYELPSENNDISEEQSYTPSGPVSPSSYDKKISNGEPVPNLPPPTDKPNTYEPEPAPVPIPDPTPTTPEQKTPEPEPTPSEPAPVPLPTPTGNGGALDSKISSGTPTPDPTPAPTPLPVPTNGGGSAIDSKTGSGAPPGIGLPNPNAPTLFTTANENPMLISSNPSTNPLPDTKMEGGANPNSDSNLSTEPVKNANIGIILST